MGGNAFGELGPDAFPRIPTDVYTRLKEHFAARLGTVYALVDIPKEVPGKLDHGDIDFVVCRALSSADVGEVNAGDTTDHRSIGDRVEDAKDRTHAIAIAKVKDVLCAKHAKLTGGFYTSNFAIPIEDVADVAHDFSNRKTDPEGPPTGTYYQVDVHVCTDEAEWDRNILFKSYGDLGMILGLIARAQGFTLGSNGLRTHFNTPSETDISSFVISQSFDDIFSFFGLSMEKWKSGFTSHDDIFRWVKTSRFFIPRRIITANPSREKKMRNKRDMYSAFLQFSHLCALEESESRKSSDSEQEVEVKLETHGGENVDEAYSPGPPDAGTESTTKGIRNRKEVQRTRKKIFEECLVYFGKKEEYNAIVKSNQRRRAFKEKFNGNKIIEWTGCNNDCIKSVMDKLRESLGNDKIADMNEDELRSVVLEIRKVIELERLHSTSTSTSASDSITS